MKDWVKMVRQTEYNYEFFTQVLSMAAAACEGPHHLKKKKTVRGRKLLVYEAVSY